ncbi:Nudix hydrolase 14, chloroplastic [Linum grandiflorum]
MSTFTLHRLLAPSPISLLHLRSSVAKTTGFRKSFALKMSSDTSSPQSLTHSITLPSQPGNVVQVVAAPGVSESEFRTAIDSSLFKQWLHNLQSESGILANGDLMLKQVLVQGVDMFGRRVGFVKFKADILDKETGTKVPGIVFARGPAVTVLILLDCEDKTYAVLTEQVRVPTGKLVLELPAGMLDDDKGDFVGTAVREVEEETGIQLKLEDMVDLTAFLNPSTGQRVIPSPVCNVAKHDLSFCTPYTAKNVMLSDSSVLYFGHNQGGCDEEISVFLYRGSVAKEVITQLQGKETGLRDHGEMIKVRVVDYDALWRMTADAKALMAIALYEMAKKHGLLPM